jgi:hypothetical protein
VEGGADPKTDRFKEIDAYSEAAQKTEIGLFNKAVAQIAKGRLAYRSVRTLKLASLL